MNFKEILIKNYGFSEDDWVYTIAKYQPLSLASKEFFLEQNCVSDKLAVVREGVLRTYIFNEDGDEVTTHFYEPGTVVLSNYSYNNQVPARESIVAISDCELLIITYNDMIDLYNRIPSWKQVCLDTAEYKNNQLVKRNLEFQTLSAGERYQKFCEKHSEVVKYATVGQIASYLGIDIATLSRIRKKLVG